MGGMKNSKKHADYHSCGKYTCELWPTQQNTDTTPSAGVFDFGFSLSSDSTGEPE
jgi:hypothetical protein